MEPIDVIEGDVSVLDRSDLDTHQIIPKQFLKRVEQTGFGEFLFYDWARDVDRTLSFSFWLSFIGQGSLANSMRLILQERTGR